ncbi:MAG TPA: hypothetical protein PKM30_05195 [Saprospiraceae bacterium]|nr:hypothetical protein [Saprospiraceae bacterium]MBX7178318.1 hypothetical protein [Saprospiraceae bacterium]MCO6470822.1 hypothetical protein [Saprospiraceae bacterium]HNB91357.1 hypothetical protein [Saprospiraceae bacterium]HNI92463.1 hypothetical protein [Saprospiraceae bacterium]
MHQNIPEAIIGDRWQEVNTRHIFLNCRVYNILYSNIIPGGRHGYILTLWSFG